MRQTDKADLQNTILKKTPSNITEQIHADAVYVVDGGVLLQRLQWTMSVSYAHLTHLYIQYVRNHFTQALVVIDGYESGPSTKDEAYHRREEKEISGDVDVGLEMQMYMKKR